MNLISRANEFSGSQTRSQRRQTWSDVRRRPATISPASLHFRRRHATFHDGRIAPYKRGVTGSNPVAPTEFLQLDGLFETLIGGPVTTAGNHRCMLPDGGKGAQETWQHPLRPPGRAVLQHDREPRSRLFPVRRARLSGRCLAGGDEQSGDGHGRGRDDDAPPYRRAEEPRFIWPSFLKSVPGTDAEWAWDTATLRTLVPSPLGSHG